MVERSKPEQIVIWERILEKRTKLVNSLTPDWPNEDELSVEDKDRLGLARKIAASVWQIRARLDRFNEQHQNHRLARIKRWEREGYLAKPVEETMPALITSGSVETPPVAPEPRPARKIRGEQMEFVIAGQIIKSGGKFTPKLLDGVKDTFQGNSAPASELATKIYGSDNPRAIANLNTLRSAVNSKVLPKELEIIKVGCGKETGYYIDQEPQPIKNRQAEKELYQIWFDYEINRPLDAEAAATRQARLKEFEISLNAQSKKYLEGKVDGKDGRETTRGQVIRQEAIEAARAELARRRVTQQKPTAPISPKPTGESHPRKSREAVVVSRGEIIIHSLVLDEEAKTITVNNGPVVKVADYKFLLAKFLSDHANHEFDNSSLGRVMSEAGYKSKSSSVISNLEKKLGQRILNQNREGRIIKWSLRISVTKEPVVPEETSAPLAFITTAPRPRISEIEKRDPEVSDKLKIILSRVKEAGVKDSLTRPNLTRLFVPRVSEHLMDEMEDKGYITPEKEEGKEYPVIPLDDIVFLLYVREFGNNLTPHMLDELKDIIQGLLA
ncbi:hypothetical protein HY404_00515 [Candidatus Microgenomates bacterium]|nr:hypothetical protein [Candidatus Microgenomates bacterium]